MASTDARPVPIKNTAFRITFALLDADGDLVTGAAGLDSEVSKDGGTFADCTNEATEIATGSGMYYLDLTSTEMNADTVAVIIKTSTSGAKTTPIVMYPQETGDILVDVQSISGDSGAADNLEAVLDGTGAAVKITTLAVTSTSVFTGNVSMAAGITITQSAANTPGIEITGNGSAAGIRSTGGATGAGIKLVGGGTSGYGLHIATTSGDGIYVAPTAGHGLHVVADGSAKHGMYIMGGASGDGIYLACSSGNGNGLAAYGYGEGHGIYSVGGDTGTGAKLIGGATSGEGFLITNTSGDCFQVIATAGDAIHLNGGGTGHGLEITSGDGATSNAIKAVSIAASGYGMILQGAGGSNGLRVIGGDTASAVRFVGGATSGYGLHCSTTSGNAIHLAPTDGHGLYAQANGTSKHGMYLLGSAAGTADGLNATAGTGGVGIRGSFLEYLLAVDYDPASKPGTSTALLNELIGNDSGVSQFTANALELAPTGGTPLSASDIRDAVGLASADLDTQLAAIASDANDSMVAAVAAATNIGTNGTGLTAVPWNAAWDAEVQSEVQDAIEANHLDHLLAVDYDPASKPGTSTALLNELIGNDGGVSQFTANALELGPAGASLTAGDIRDAIGMASADLDTQLSAIAVDADTAATLAGTAAASAASAAGYALDNKVTLGTAGAGLTNIPWNASWDAEVQSEVQDAIVANHLDHLLAVDYDPASKPGVSTALLNELVGNDGGVSQFTANALELAPSGGSSLTAEDVADAVWDADISSHVTADTFGLLLGSTYPGEFTTLGGAIDNVQSAIVDVADTQTAHGVILDRVPASPAAVGSAMTLADDAITYAKIADTAFRDQHFEVPTLTGPADNDGVVSMIVQTWRRFFKKVQLDSSTLTTYADDGTTPITTQARSESSGVQTLGDGV